MKKKVFLIGFMTIMCLFLTSCGSNKDYTSGDIEGIHYEETNDVTNYVKMVTNKEKVILIELYPDIAPLTVANFQDLVSQKFYDNLTFHRVVKDFMIQTGDPTATGTGGSDKTIKGEFKSNGVENDLKHEEGIVSMARSNDYDSASSQFFICVNNNDSLKSLDGEYAAFGKVIAGYDAVVEISQVETNNNDKPISIQRIESIRFVNIKD